MLGFTISAFCLSGLFAKPLMGRWSDKVGKTKHIFLFANLFEIVGNIMYFLGISSWMLVAGRFVAGIGTGVGAPIIADIMRVTSNAERTGFISIFMAIRQFGLIIGPAFNLFLRKINFSIGGFPVDKYSGPGAFMAVLWILLEIIVLVLYWDLPALHREIAQESIDHDHEQTGSQYKQPVSHDTSQAPDEGSTVPHVTCVSPGEHLGARQRVRHPQVNGMRTSANNVIESTDHPAAIRESVDTADPPTTVSVGPSSEEYVQINENDYENHKRVPDESSTSQATPSLSLAYYYDEFIREEVIAILAIVFIGFFNQTCMEAIISPLAQKLIDWDEFEISLLFCGAGIEIILVFIMVRILSRYLRDRVLLLLGYSIVLVTIGGLVYALPNAPPHNPSYNLPFFLTGVILDVFGLPIMVVTSTSLFSKITREETQGFAQGVRGVCVGIGTLLGPLWADSLIENLYLVFGVMFGLMFLTLVMFLLSFKHMKDQGTETHAAPSHSVNGDIVEDSERQPLLGNRS